MRYLIEGCLAYPNGNQQLLALYWGLACAYRATVQYSQRTVVEAGTQTTTTVIAPAVKTKQWTRKTTGPYHRLVREEEEEERFDQEAGPSTKELEEGVREFRQEAETIWSLISSEFRDMWKDYSCQPGEQIAAWLLQCWDNGANSQQLEGGEKHPIVTSPEAPSILGIDYLRRGYFKDPRRYFKDPKGYRWAFEQQVPIATRTAHWWQYHTNQDSLAIIHELIHQLQSQRVISKTCSPFNSPRLTVDYCGLNEGTPPLSAAVPDMLELQYELELKAAKWYATIDIANAFFSIPLAAECRPQFAFTWRGVQYTWNQLPQGWKCSPTICHRLIQTALEKGDASEHLEYINDIIVWGNKAEEVFEKGKKVIQILLKAGFAIKKNKVKGPAQEIQFLGIKWQDGRRRVVQDVVNKIATMSPPANKKETQAFLGLVGFWRMHIAEVVGTEAYLLLAPQLPVLHWMFKGNNPTTHHATSATWSKWVVLIKQQARLGKPNHPGILEEIMERAEGRDFGALPEEVARAQRHHHYNELSEDKMCYALFTEGSCHVVGNHWKWKAAVWSPTQEVIEATE
ncbi:hypothetical protein QYF61_010997 [Mycteria americana]|uniref:ribonuclease H n=1 Tax=Mycteria americana TaxID=33587 RepID=A0AAN7RZK4_MYCAM|nr:hypothetical protein QYF61_010997 [Mycteria americana]